MYYRRLNRSTPVVAEAKATYKKNDIFSIVTSARGARKRERVKEGETENRTWKIKQLLNGVSRACIYISTCYPSFLEKEDSKSRHDNSAKFNFLCPLDVCKRFPFLLHSYLLHSYFSIRTQGKLGIFHYHIPINSSDASIEAFTTLQSAAESLQNRFTKINNFVFSLIIVHFTD